MGPSVMRQYVHKLDRGIPTLYKYIGKILWINQVDINASTELSLKIYLLDYSTDRIGYVGCIFKIFAHPKAEDLWHSTRMDKNAISNS